jgi:hypothetical protein
MKSLPREALSEHLHSIIGLFSDSPQSAIFAIDQPLPNGMCQSLDHATFSDVDRMCDLELDGAQLRVWFDSANYTRSYIGLHRDQETLRLTVSADSPEDVDRLFVAIIAEFSFEETESWYERYTREKEEALKCPFDFNRIVGDQGLANVLLLRWQESRRTLNAEAYLSTIVLLGSILEGVLLDKVQKNPKEANQAKSTPKLKGQPLKFSEWRLTDLIAVACELKWLRQDIQAFSHTLREYRNLIHPRLQSERDVLPDQHICNIADEIVGATFDDLSR